MSKKPLLIVLALVLVALAGFWFLLDDSSSASRRAPAAARTAGPTGEESATDEAAQEQLTTPATPAAATARAEAAPVAVERALENVASAAGDSQNFDVQSAKWVEVDVVLPTGLPLDDVTALVSIALPARGEISPWEERSIGSEVDLSTDFPERLDGGTRWARRELTKSAVRLPFPADAESGFIVLQSRYAYAERQSVQLAESSTTVTIVASLGAYVTGRLIPPNAASPATLRPEQFELSFAGFPKDGMLFQTDSNREVHVRDDLTFELRALSADRRYMVRLEAENFVNTTDANFEVVAGEHEVLDLPLAVGATISGRVLGAGEPLDNARVRTGGGPMDWMRGGGETANTGQDGAYRIAGIAPGKVRLSVEAEGWLEAEAEPLELADGQQLTGFDIELERGSVIAGSVQWPDGSPASRAGVTAYTRNQRGLDEAAETRTDKDGMFELGGLEEGAFEIHAQPGGPTVEIGEVAALRGLGYVDEETATEEEKVEKVAGRHNWIAIARQVAAPNQNLVLTLEAPLSIAGIVVDDRGQPVQDFKVEASPAGSVRWARGPGRVEHPFKSEDGSFSLEGVYEGDWRVKASAEGFAEASEELQVSVPQLEESLRITLPRAVRVTGQVVDPAGQPVAGADLSLNSGGQPDFTRFFRNNVKSESDGTFVLEGVSPEGSSLAADHTDWAPSEELVLSAEPGSDIEGVVLALRVGATITGEVYDENGEPDADQNVGAGQGPAFFGASGNQTRTDSAGRFRLEHITPGKVTVTASPSQEELLEGMAEADGDESAMIGMMSQMRTTSVEVADGEEVHVVLGSEPKNPVRVHGTLTEAGAPLGDIQLLVIEEGGALLQGMKSARTDADGRYDVTLDRPGDFVFNVNKEGLGFSAAQFYVEVPEVEEHEANLALPMGRVEGRILGPDGSPEASISVRLRRTDGVVGMEDLDQGSARASEGDGSFLFEHLWPGTYDLQVGGVGNFMVESADNLGSLVVPGIEVNENENVDGIEVRLAAAGKLTGRVLDAGGEPVGGAAIFVRDASGRLITNLSSVMSNAAGRFTYPGLSPGRVTVSARSDAFVSAESRAVEIRSGESTELEIRVDTGTYFEVSLTEDKEPVRARVRVEDEAGRQVNGLYSIEDLQSFFSEGFSSRERRVGPVPPGKYTLIATTLDGKEAKKSVTAKAGQSLRKIRLRLR